MKPTYWILATFLTSSATAWAQGTTPTPMTPIPPGGPMTQPSASGGGVFVALALAAALIILLGVSVKLFDLKRKRESEAVLLQSQISDALLREHGMFGLPVTATARVPFWAGTPATIEVVGQIPSPEMGESVLRIVRDEALRIRHDVRIEDRLTVNPTMARAAA